MQVSSSQRILNMKFYKTVTEFLDD